jgi:hypothetical protein
LAAFFLDKNTNSCDIAIKLSLANEWRLFFFVIDYFKRRANHAEKIRTDRNCLSILFWGDNYPGLGRFL